MASGASQLSDFATPSAASLPFMSGAEHLAAELDLLRLLLHREVLRLRAAGLFTEDQFRGLYVSDQQIDSLLLNRASSRPEPEHGTTGHPSLQELETAVQYQKTSIEQRALLSSEASITLPLPRLTQLFGLDEFEIRVLMIAAAAELHLHFETLFSYAQNDVNKKRPSINLALKLLCSSVEECWRRRGSFDYEAPLIKHNLMTIPDDGGKRDFSFLARPIAVDERVVDFLLGQAKLDVRLQRFTTIAKSDRQLSDLRLPQTLIGRLRNTIFSAPVRGQVLVFQGPAGSGKRVTAAAVCAAAGQALLVADLSGALLAELHLKVVLPLLHREAILSQADLMLTHADVLTGEEGNTQQNRVFFQRMLECEGEYRIFLASEAPLAMKIGVTESAPAIFEFPIPAFPDRVHFWQAALSKINVNGHAGPYAITLSNKFMLTGGEIGRACCDAEKLALGKAPGSPITLEDLEAGARAQAHHGLQRLAKKITSFGEWSDLVLPWHCMRQLRDVSAAEKYRHLVYSQWGFDERLAMGKGLTVLFYGASGTGKTMAAGVLARDLALDLYKVDLSMVVSKYIGETEKQLSQVFREARASNAILFFDEADALFGKRSEVKDAHDRYANLEVAYLLQKMEEHEGIVILATNLRKNLDDAFTRRIQYIVEFPFPGIEDRERIWRGIMPAQAPLADDVDFGFLARQFELAGGNIRNVALAAAFLGAEEDCPIRMEHFVVATARELQKMGKLPSRSEFREHYELIRSRA